MAGRPRQYFTPAALVFLEAVVAGLQDNSLVSDVNAGAVKRFMRRSRTSLPRQRSA